MDYAFFKKRSGTTFPSRLKFGFTCFTPVQRIRKPCLLVSETRKYLWTVYSSTPAHLFVVTWAVYRAMHYEEKHSSYAGLSCKLQSSFPQHLFPSSATKFCLYNGQVLTTVLKKAPDTYL